MDCVVADMDRAGGGVFMAISLLAAIVEVLGFVMQLDKARETGLTLNMAASEVVLLNLAASAKTRGRTRLTKG